MRRVTGDQQVPVGIERSDVDASLAHGVKDVARGQQISDHLGVERRPLRRAVGQQMVPEGVESGLGVRDRPARASAEGVLERVVGSVLRATYASIASLTAGSRGGGRYSASIFFQMPVARSLALRAPASVQFSKFDQSESSGR